MQGLKLNHVSKRGPRAQISWPSLENPCSLRYPSETLLITKFREISFVHNLLINYLIVLNFCTNHGSDTVKNVETVGQLKQMFWTNEISRDSSLKCVSDVYPILHSNPVYFCGECAYFLLHILRICYTQMTLVFSLTPGIDDIHQSGTVLCSVAERYLTFSSIVSGWIIPSRLNTVLINLSWMAHNLLC